MESLLGPKKLVRSPETCGGGDCPPLVSARRKSLPPQKKKKTLDNAFYSWNCREAVAQATLVGGGEVLIKSLVTGISVLGT